jgi:hypothetical protein
MDRVRFIEHKGKNILVVDLSDSKGSETTGAILAAAREKIDIQPPKSLLLLTNVTGTHYNTEGAEALKAYTKANTPFIKASAAVGVVGIKLILYKAILKLTGRQIAAVGSVEAGLDWLAGQ